MHEQPPSFNQGMAALAIFLAVGGAVGFVLRPVLRNPLVSRTLAIYIVVIVSQVSAVIVRTIVSLWQYGLPLRERDWPYLWAVGYAVAICGALIGGNHIVKLLTPDEEVTAAASERPKSPR